ncbi:histidine kinase dimerization/phosphoacceptor domain-containing protein [Streptomyces sp. R11]|uniref:Histidine kinase dimerization/phosphoacceptor domain-containing protein n=1 Tax=Streptomyces sp. R11 TaxID=3238625 RepID=A0AB39N899_9ACTN
MKSATPRGCARGFAVGFLFAACVVDVLYAGSDGTGVLPLASPVRPTAAVLLVGLTAVLWPAGRRPAWLTPQMRTAAPAAASILYAAGSLLAGARSMFGPGEALILLCLLFVAVRQCPPRWAVACAALDVAALLLMPVRYMRSVQDEAPALIVLGLVLVGVFAGLAAYLRTPDCRRTVTVGETPRAERVAIAADLHDFVTHHVTGILVQTQMARMTARTQPQELDPVLARHRTRRHRGPRLDAPYGRRAARHRGRGRRPSPGRRPGGHRRADGRLREPGPAGHPEPLPRSRTTCPMRCRRRPSGSSRRR